MRVSGSVRAMALGAAGLWVAVTVMVFVGMAGGPTWPSLESLLRAMALGVTVVGVQWHTSRPLMDAYDEGVLDGVAGGRRAGDPRPTTAELRIIRGGRGA